MTLIAFGVVVAVFAPGTDPATIEALPPPTTSAAPTTTTTTVAVTTTPAPTSTTEPEASDPHGGVAIVAIPGPAPESVHPWLGEGSPIIDAVAAVTHARAFSLDPVTLDPVPEVLIELPGLDNGGLVYHEDGSVTVTLRIRPQARWQDGMPITGSDLEFTADLLSTDPRLPDEVLDRYRLIDPDSWLVGPATVRFDLVERSLEYLALFDPILPRHQLEGTDLFEDWQDRPWLSAGPFRVTRIDETGVTLTANRGYWQVGADDERLPYLSGLEVRAALGEEETSEAWADADVVALSSGAPADGQGGFSIQSAPGREWEHLAFQFGSGRLDVNPGSLNASETFRSVTASLIDREGLVDEFFPGVRQPLRSVVGASWPDAAGAGWPATGDVPDDFLDQIASELDTTFPEAPTVELVTTDSLDRTQFAGAVLQSLASAGIGVEVALVDPGLFFRDFVIAGEFDLAEFAWTATPGPAGAVKDLEERFVSGPTSGGFNFYRWGSPDAAGTGEETEAFRALVGELDSEMDLEVLRGRLTEADDILAAHTVVVPLYLELTRSAVADHLLGFSQPAGGLPVTLGAAFWQKAEEPS